MKSWEKSMFVSFGWTVKRYEQIWIMSDHWRAFLDILECITEANVNSGVPNRDIVEETVFFFWFLEFMDF